VTRSLMVTVFLMMDGAVMVKEASKMTKALMVSGAISNIKALIVTVVGPLFWLGS
jgi:hypothetical protein